MAIPRFSGGKLSNKIAWESGCKAPPPAPCSTRAMIRMLRSEAMPQTNEEMVKMAMQVTRKRFLPKYLANQPLAGRKMALETR